MTISTGPVIGLLGKARSGKDTVAQVLVEDHGFERFAFADELRDMLVEIDPLVDNETSLVSALSALGDWEAFKQAYPDAYRRLMRGVGGSITQRDAGFFVRLVMGQLGDRPAVITDVREPAEYEAIVAAGATLVRVVRPGADGDDHRTETALDGVEVDYTVHNDGTLDDLTVVVDGIVAAAWR